MPDAAGLENVKVVFSLNVCEKLVPLFRLTVVALALELTAEYSSLMPLSKVTTPLASAVTALDASVVPSVVMSR